MGFLTGEMTRLCDEIMALRGARETLIKDLIHGARDLQKSVAEMQASFRQAHAEMARKTGAERTAFISGLKQTVLGLRTDFATELAGARKAWFGPSPAERLAREQAERRREEEEARRLREQEERRAKEEKRRLEAEASRKREEERRAQEAEEERRRAEAARKREEEERRAREAEEAGRRAAAAVPEEEEEEEQETAIPLRDRIRSKKKKR